MDQTEFILQNLNIEKNIFKRISTFVDFGNVNHWFDRDRAPFFAKPLKNKEKISIDIHKFGSFIDLFSEKKFFYYGIDPKNKASIHIQSIAGQARFKTNTKNIQFIHQYIDQKDFSDQQLALLSTDKRGPYLETPKCNFDVELTIDALRLSGKYDTFALFSSDSDFGVLLSYLKNIGKKIILFHSGPTSFMLKKYADLAINGQRIRENICYIK